MMNNQYDVIVIGAGHAGAEAALATARLKLRTLLLTINLDSIALLACNPSVGGTAKGHLVREIDALGGEMGLLADKSLLQIKMLNLGKGPAVHSLRGQIDKHLYHINMKRTLEEHSNITLKQGEVSEIIVHNGKVQGVKTTIGADYYASAVIIATGVYLNARIITGEHIEEAGPSGFARATHLTKNLISHGLKMRRFKTGTPARILRTSLNFEEMEIQEGDSSINTFSFMNDDKLYEQTPCYLTYTNEVTHQIIRDNIHRSPLYNGCIDGIGARYCPSIEDKVMRFVDKDRHQIFIEPEGKDTLEMYVQGLSSSLPYDIQEKMYRSVKGMERVEIVRYAYAIEYDCIDPTTLELSLMSKDITGLFMAGQMNGSSGYEEAAAQGLIAGINAAQYLSNKSPFILRRDQAYIGVLIDDLVTKGTNEPYRMMTARAEYRLNLRQGNADLRLTELGYQLGLATEERYSKMLCKRNRIKEYETLLDKVSSPKEYRALLESKGENHKNTGMTYRDILKRPSIKAEDMIENFQLFQENDLDAMKEVEVNVKYEGYLKRQSAMLKEVMQLECKELPDDINYLKLEGLRIEARQKLNQIRPKTLGQASRISGVSPADINVLLIYLARVKK